MICSNCGKECEEFLNLSDCCNAEVDFTGSKYNDDHSCPCPTESPENCQSCQTTRDIRKLQIENEKALSQLYSKEQIREVLCSVGVSGYVRDLIMERFE